MKTQMKQVELNVNDLRNDMKLFIATPMYGGNCMEPYFRSCIKLITFFNKHQLSIGFGTIANESLVTRARNVLVSYFLSSDYTHLLFIDGDIEFDVESVLKLYAHKKPVVAGAYPKKGLNWRNIHHGLLSNQEKDYTPQEIAALGADYAINFKFLNREDKSIAVENGLIKLHDTGTGFMMIKRETILKMIKAYPELKYNNDVNLNGENKDNFYALFDTMIDPIDRRYLSEDYTFCRRWQELGGDIYLDPTINLNHYGHFCFSGNPSQIIEFKPMETEVDLTEQEVISVELPD